MIFADKLLSLYKHIMNLCVYNGIPWCRKAKSNGAISFRVNKFLYKDYKQKWGRLSRIVLKEYLEVFGGYFEQDADRLNIVPEDIFRTYIEPVLNPFLYRAYFEDKNFFVKILGKKFFPHEFLRCIQGTYYDGDYNYIPTEQVADFLQRIGENVKEIILKPSVDSCSGRGIYFFDLKNNLFVERHSGKSVVELIAETGIQNFVVQEVVIQSKFMNYFNSTSVNTLRVVTYRSVKDEVVYVPSMILRIGHAGSLVDNAHAGGVFVGVDPKTGALGKYVTNQYGEKKIEFNGINFSEQNFTVPEFDRVLKFAKDVHEKIPYHRLLALDVVQLENGDCKLVEYNIGGFSTWLFPFVGQSPFGIWTDEIIEYVETRKNVKRIWTV